MTEKKYFLIGKNSRTSEAHDGLEVIDWQSPKIRYVSDICRDNSVLDLGCVQHDPSMISSSKWLHKAIASVASETIGLDLYEPGVHALNEIGYEVVHGDAQNFDLARKFDVIVAGDLIEHLDNFDGFLKACIRHMHNESKLVICTPNPWHWQRAAYAAFTDVPVNGEHTCWLCPKTLEQLIYRYNLKSTHLEYGSLLKRHGLFPMPKRLRHTSFFVTIALDEL